jgi:hypothetical protein
MHALNSVAAAKDVMAADGPWRSLIAFAPKLVHDLEEIASHRRRGDQLWWAVTAKPRFSERRPRSSLPRRFGPDGELGDLIAAVSEKGYRLTTAASFPVNEGVSVYDYILSFAGEGQRTEVEQAVARFASARLAGAFEQRG